MPDTASNRAAGHARGLAVLVVEDDDARFALGALLEMWGHRVDSSGDGGAALDVMRAGMPDVAFIDIGIPGLSGYELAAAVRKEFPAAAVLLIALTGRGKPADRVRAKVAGFDLHLVKPAGEVDLRAALDRAFDTKLL